MHVFESFEVTQIQNTFSLIEFEYLNETVEESLRNTIQIIFSPGKGLLLADESLDLLGEKLEKINLENVEDNRINYRKVILKSGLQNYVSCGIFHKEVLNQLDDLIKSKIVFGVKADKGVCEQTKGLDDIKERCASYAEKGCRATKWRCIFEVSENKPSYQDVIEASNSAAKYARVSQNYSMVPLVDIIIKAAGSEDLKFMEEVTENILCLLFKAFNDHHVLLEGLALIMRPVTCGKSCVHKDQQCDNTPAATFVAFNRAIPPALGGIIFSDETLPVCEASIRLNNLIRYVTRKPWPITFAMGRNYVEPVISIWKGDQLRPNLTEDAQQELLKRLELFSFSLYESSGTEHRNSFKEFIKTHAYR